MKTASTPQVTAADILGSGPVIPVIVIKDITHAVPLAKALLAGGIRVLEITLRSDAALAAIRQVSREVPEALVGAGTVASAADLAAVAEAGGRFAISPGLTPKLLAAAKEAAIPLIPGISTVSELMLGMETGLRQFKFFPAEAAGGTRMLQAIGGPFPGVSFCPTGGITPENYRAYLALANVSCVGGSWLAPRELMQHGDWEGISTLARRAVADAQP